MRGEEKQHDQHKELSRIQRDYFGANAFAPYNSVETTNQIVVLRFGYPNYRATPVSAPPSDDASCQAEPERVLLVLRCD